MISLSLNGSWMLIHFPEGKLESLAQHAPETWPSLGEPVYEAHVPGNVELDLVRAGALPEPFVGSNIRDLRALETHEWWYALSFQAPQAPGGTRFALVFEGLDTLATIWLNGKQVGESDNMLIEQRFEVSGSVRPGEENWLVVRLGSALNHARQYEYDAVTMSWERREEGLYLRKAPHVWGWDIMPRAVSAGIWRPVRLESIPDTAIEQIYYYTLDATPQRALLGARFQFRTPEPELNGFEMRFHGECGEHTFDYHYPVEFTSAGCTISVPGAKFWWPKGYGDPALYTVTARLYHQGTLVAERSDRVGMRKLVVKRTELAGKPYIVEPAVADQARINTPPDP